MNRDIEKAYRELQENKLKIFQKQELKNKEIKYIISDNPTNLYAGETVYSHKLLLYIRKYQSIMYKILIQAKKDQKHILGTLLGDFMYNNIFSSDSIQEELLIMLYRTLQHEIKSLSNSGKPSEFLKDSINQYILNNLAKKQDVKAYFGKVIIGLTDLFEGQEETKELIFEPKKLSEEVSKQKALKMKQRQEQNLNKIGSSQIKNDSENFDIIFGSDKSSGKLSSILPLLDSQTFYSKYIPDLNKEQLREKYEMAKDTCVKDYIGKQINKADSSKLKDGLFANTNFVEIIFKSNDSTHLLNLYQLNFTIVIELINRLFAELGKTVSAIPNSIRYICKIISILVKNRFPNISQVELNAFVSEFFVKQIILPLFVNPELSGLMTSKYITKSTKYNMTVIGFIMQKLLSAEFYTSTEDPSMTIFNWYFIEQMPEIIKFFDKLTDVELPDVLEYIIKNDLSQDKNDFDIETFVFDYFKEHPDEQIFYHNICYNAEQLLAIIDIMERNKDSILQTPKHEFQDEQKKEYVAFVKAFEKLIESYHIDHIKKVVANDIKTNTKTFSLIISEFYGPKMKAISKLKTKHFALPEISSPKNDDDRKMNTVIRVKNSLSEILYNIHNIPKKDFFGIKINNIKDFVDALTEISKINYYNLTNSIQTEWYILTLRSLIYQVPEEYKENNYEKLFTELTHDLKQSISKIDYDTMSTVVDSYRYLDKELKKSIQNVKDFEQIEFNRKVKKFIYSANVEVNIRLKETDKGQKQLEIGTKNTTNANKLKHSETPKSDKKSEKNYTCENISEFIQIFPNIVKSFPFNDKETIFDFESNLCLPKVLATYFEKLKETINAYPEFDFYQIMKDLEPEIVNQEGGKSIDKKEIQNKGMNRVYQEVVNYVMDRIYDRIFPIEPELDDYKIYQQCASLGWIEPHHICSFGKANLDDFLPQTVGYINRLDITKNPSGKMNLFGKIEEIVLNTLNFIFGKCEGGVDDLLPLLLYVIIKSSPKCFASHLKYIELYPTHNETGKDGQRLTMLSAVKERLLDFKATDLIDVEMEEYCK